MNTFKDKIDTRQKDNIFGTSISLKASLSTCHLELNLWVATLINLVTFMVYLSSFHCNCKFISETFNVLKV